MRTHVEEFCNKIGKDPLIVQGAGGNVSWKDASTLWIKASGKWLAKSMEEDIFVSTDLDKISIAVKEENYSFTPLSISPSSLRPSIETILHALMPQKFIVHVHAVEILSILIRMNSKDQIKFFLGNDFNYIFLDYYKPGEDLAQALHKELIKNPDSKVVFLANHGIVIGSDDLAQVDELLCNISERLQTKPSIPEFNFQSSSHNEAMNLKGYKIFKENKYNALVHSEEFLDRLENDWAICPDHVVFLGHEAKILDKNIHIKDIGSSYENTPPFIFCAGSGIYESPCVTSGQRAQLDCYYELLIRQPKDQKLRSLKPHQISELLNWDAEKYRQSMK